MFNLPKNVANDPKENFLPVKENNFKIRKGFPRKSDHQTISKLSKCELEDRVLRLLDEQTQLKKIIHCQEEKIKRLGTKLLRLIHEKKSGKKNLLEIKETEDLHLRIVELEHENYSLKDKNTVLRQQLSSHSKHISAHISPIRSNHTSPLMSMRQTAPRANSEGGYDLASKNEGTKSQLQAAEAHIEELNEEIKCLHFKINSLQQNLERHNLDNRKMKIIENIELIRLQRSLKQQAIQIATLQAQVKNSENYQKELKEELIKAHNENDEALQIISVKQNEIIQLCNKLEEKNLSRLEEDELKERIKDLMVERDSLKERSELLMKTINIKAEEAARINELKTLLGEEKVKKKKLEEALEEAKQFFHEMKNNINCHKSNKECLCADSSEIVFKGKKERVNFTEGNNLKIDNGNLTVIVSEKTEKENDSPASVKESASQCECNDINFSKPSFENNAELFEVVENIPDNEGKDLTDKEILKIPKEVYYAEKIKLERELHYLREMLRNQTSRCETQQAEISRLMYELRLNEEKCNDTLRKLDLHLKIFQHLELRAHQNNLNENLSESYLEEPDIRSKNVKKTAELDKKEIITTSNEELKNESRENKSISSTESLFYKMDLINKDSEKPTSIDIIGKANESETRKRFVDHVFLESSDEEFVHEKPFKRESFLKSLDELEDENTMLGNKKKPYEENDEKITDGAIGFSRQLFNKTKSLGGSLSSKFPSDSSLAFHAKNGNSDYERDLQVQTPINETGIKSQEKPYVKITILWLKIQPSSLVWKDEKIKLIFIDFTFLDVKGEETETPNSLPKPKTSKEKCNFNFSREILITDAQKKILQSLSNKVDLDLVVFKVVSDSEDFPKEFECEDLGVAVVTVKMFVDKCGLGPFHIKVKNINNAKEVIGTLAISLVASPGLMDFKN